MEVTLGVIIVIYCIKSGWHVKDFWTFRENMLVKIISKNYIYLLFHQHTSFLKISPVLNGLSWVVRIKKNQQIDSFMWMCRLNDGKGGDDGGDGNDYGCDDGGGGGDDVDDVDDDKDYATNDDKQLWFWPISSK